MPDTTEYPNQHEAVALDPTSAQRVLKMVHTNDKAYSDVFYEDLIGADAYTSGPLWTPEQKDHAQFAMGNFLHFFDQLAGGIAKAAGEEGAAQLSADELSDPEQAVSFIRNWQALAGKEVRVGYKSFNLPYLEYQNRDNDKLRVDDRGTFLHFGEAQTLSPEFASDIRVYINPKPEDAAMLAGVIMAATAEYCGVMPKGKFSESSRDARSKQRLDKLIFYANSPTQLSAILMSAAYASERWPFMFEGQESIVLGQSVELDGVEIPTVRIGQTPTKAMEELQGDKNVSFGQHRARLLQRGVHELNDSLAGQPLSPVNDADKLAQIMQPISEAAGIHPENFNFNADQDLDVIAIAIEDAAFGAQRQRELEALATS